MFFSFCFCQLIFALFVQTKSQYKCIFVLFCALYLNNAALLTILPYFLYTFSWESETNRNEYRHVFALKQSHTFCHLNSLPNYMSLLILSLLEPWVGCEILLVSALPYPNLFGTKGFVVVVVVVAWTHRGMLSDCRIFSSLYCFYDLLASIYCQKVSNDAIFICVPDRTVSWLL